MTGTCMHKYIHTQTYTYGQKKEEGRGREGREGEGRRGEGREEKGREESPSN